MKLDKVLSIWRDLEDSYIVNKDKLNVKNRDEYLKKITGYNEKTGKTFLINLKVELGEEEQNYDVNQLNEYNNLMNLFNKLDNKIKEVKGITDLNRFVSTLVRGKNFNINKTELFNILNKGIFDVDKTRHEILLNDYRLMGDIITLDKSLKMISSVDSADSLFFKNKESLLNAKDNIKSLTNFEKKALIYFYKVLGKFEPMTLFINKDKLTDKLSRKILDLSEEKIVGEIKYKVGRINTNLGEGSVVIFV